MKTDMRSILRLFRISLIAAAAAALILYSSGQSLAWFSESPVPSVNEVYLARFDIEITGRFSGQTQKQVRIKNNSNVKAYVRAALAAVWLDENGDISAEQASEPAFSLSADWFLRDGFYFYRAALEPGASTTDLFSSIQYPTHEGLRYELQIIASGIQITPSEAVEGAWAVTVDSGGYLTPALP